MSKIAEHIAFQPYHLSLKKYRTWPFSSLQNTCSHAFSDGNSQIYDNYILLTVAFVTSGEGFLYVKKDPKPGQNAKPAIEFFSHQLINFFLFVK